MSKKETPLTRWYWRQVGGLLVEEFQVVTHTSTNSPRYVDGLIVLGEATTLSETRAVDISGRDVIVVQTKAQRLGMYLMGQCLFSKLLVEQLGPRSIKSVALCTKDDDALRPLLEQFDGCEVVIYDRQRSAGQEFS
jgi:hypothetical protein